MAAENRAWLGYWGMRILAKEVVHQTCEASKSVQFHDDVLPGNIRLTRDRVYHGKLPFLVEDACARAFAEDHAMWGVLRQDEARGFAIAHVETFPYCEAAIKMEAKKRRHQDY